MVTVKDWAEVSILVVDDEPDNIDLLERTLCFDYQVFRASSGEEALALLPTIPNLAVIITDQRMPGVTGTQLLQRARALRSDAIRIILTGYTDPVDLIEAINSSNVYRYMTKPWSVDELTSVVRRAVRLYAAGGGELVDDATGLPNLGLLRLETAREMARSARSGRDFAVITIEVRGYREYVGQAGLAAAERLMQQVVGKVGDVIRMTDMLGVAGQGKLVLIATECADTASFERRLVAQVTGLEAFSQPAASGLALTLEMLAVRYPECQAASAQDLLARAGLP
ncbi:MAG: response regulator [Proteobacteria bacterium]|nr:response regulator [Pseudomonadota bacterium]